MKEFRALVEKSGYFDNNRKRQQIEWMYNNIHEELRRLFYSSSAVKNRLEDLEKDILESRISPVKAAERIIAEFKNSL